MRVSASLSEESLFGFLSSTRLPVVSSLAALIRWMSLAMAVAGTCYATACLLLIDDGFYSAALPWSGALPAMLSAPLFAIAWSGWRSHKLERAATWLFIGLFTLMIAANWPRGVFSPAWYLHPVLSLLATTCLGVISGLLLTMVAVTTLLLATVMRVGEDIWPIVAPDAWVHSISLAAVTLASALAGALVNRLLFLTLVTAESQRRKNFDASRALRHREKLLRHALRVETVGDLAGMVCHQLRNTFQVLQGHVTLGSLADDEERQRRLVLIEEALHQSQPLLDQLMRMAHPDEGTVTPCDLSELLQQFHEQAQRVVPGSVRIVCEVSSETPTVLLNPHGMLHALWNLVINAKQAIEGDGTITLRSGCDRHQVWVEVADTGGGMPDAVRERIFDPYFTTKPVGQGTGLGLTAVARFIRASNGLIQVDSTAGRGTTFRMRFPRAGKATKPSTERVG